MEEDLKPKDLVGFVRNWYYCCRTGGCCKAGHQNAKMAQNCKEAFGRTIAILMAYASVAELGVLRQIMEEYLNKKKEEAALKLRKK